MRQYIKHLATAAVVASISAACSGSGGAAAADCEPQHEFSTVKEGTLTVSTFDLPPYTKVEGSEISGVDGQILNEIAERECLTITVMPLDAPAVIPAVESGRADLAAGDWYRTAERAAVVALSAPIYTDQMGIISTDGVDSISDVEGLKVGTVDGYLWVADLQAYLGGGLTTYPSSTAMWQDLTSGRIDIGVDSVGAAVYANESIGDGNYTIEVATEDPAIAASLEPAQAGFPMAKDNDALAEAINADIEALMEDGTIADILEANGLERSAADTGDPRLIE